MMLPYPISANRYWRTARGITYVSKDAIIYRKAVAMIARVEQAKHHECPLQIDVVYHPKLTKKGEASKVVLDLDNVLKVAIDALKGVCYPDDKQIKRIVACYGEPIVGGGMSVELTPL